MSDGCCVDRNDVWISWEEEDAILNFSDSMLERLGWQDGDELIFTELEDGAFSISKYEDND